MADFPTPETPVTTFNIKNKKLNIKLYNKDFQLSIKGVKYFYI